jgi:hypothetical protein
LYTATAGAPVSEATTTTVPATEMSIAASSATVTFRKNGLGTVAFASGTGSIAGQITFPIV